MKARKLSAILLAGALMATPVITSTAMAESSQTESTESADSTQNIVDESGNLIIEGTTVTGLTEQGYTAENIVIPDGVTEIGEGAFDNCESLKSIDIPDSVNYIDKFAFYYCINLENVYIPKDITMISHGTFWGCKSLKSVSIPDSITVIEDCAFYECSSLKNVDLPENLEMINDSAFSNSGLESINIPDGVFLGEAPFAGCANLTSINVSDKNESYCSVDGVLFNKDKTTIIAYPPNKKGTTYSIPDGVTSIGAQAFKGCESLTSVTIPDSVTEIGHEAFSYCTNFEEITIPDSVKEIGEYVFNECFSLTSVTIPNNATKIVDGLFSNCSALKSITIPDSITEIGTFAFYCCDSLINITIPESVIDIGDGAFYCCSGLKSITIPDGVTEIKGSTFLGCYNLENVSIPDSVTKIGYRALAGTNLKNLTIPNSVKEIGLEVCRCDMYGEKPSDIYFDGTKDEWEKIAVIDAEGQKTSVTVNDLFPSSTLHFKSADPEEKPVVEYTADEETGITASTEEGVIEEGAVLTVTPVEEKTDNENTYGFDISFKNGEKEVQPNGKVTITIPVPEPFKKLAKIYVYHVLNGKYYDMKAAIDENGNIVFETDHFSEYVVTSVEVEGALENENSDSSDNDNSSDNSDNESSNNSSDSENSNSGSDKSPNTGFGGIAMTLGVFALAGAAIVVTKKYQR